MSVKFQVVEHKIGTTTTKTFLAAMEVAEAASRKNNADVVVYMVETEVNGVTFYDKVATLHPHPKAI